MSELKAISGHEIREDIDYNTRGIDPEDEEWCNYGKELCDTLYYLKSEADKVIALLKDKANYNEYAYKHKSEELADTCRFYEKELRRHKYKRCLAMANWCESEAYIHEYGSEYDEDLVAWFGKWHKRWMKLAEKFNGVGK